MSGPLSGKWIGSRLTTILFKCLFVNSFFKQRSYEIRLLTRSGHANNLDEIGGSKRDYIHWLLGVSSGGQAELGTILTPQAIDMLATKLRTPLQVQLHLTLALEAGYQAGEKPVTAELVETVLSHQIGDLEPTLARHGYSPQIQEYYRRNRVTLNDASKGPHRPLGKHIFHTTTCVAGR